MNTGPPCESRRKVAQFSQIEQWPAHGRGKRRDLVNQFERHGFLSGDSQVAVLMHFPFVLGHLDVFPKNRFGAIVVYVESVRDLLKHGRCHAYGS